MSAISNRKWYSVYPKDMDIDPYIPEDTLYALLKETVTRFGNRTAIIYDEKQISYRQLLDAVNRLANAWNSLGLKKGERIGLMVSNQPDYIIAYYAAMQLGLIVVQINPNYTARELLQITIDAQMKYIICEANHIEKVGDIAKTFSFAHVFVVGENTSEGISLDSLIETYEPSEKRAPIIVREDIAVIQYTGGTSGVVKGAMLTHYNLVANVIQSYAMYGKEMYVGKETVLTTLPLYHVYAMTSAMNLGVYIGATNIVIQQFQVDTVLKEIKRYQPTFFPGVPRIYNALISHPDIKNYGLNCFKFCSSGSAPLPVEVLRKFEKITGAVIGEGFGLSEASPSTHRNPSTGKRKIGSIGLPLPGTDCIIVDNDNQELPENAVGELLIRGPQVMKGYWNNQEETNKALKNNWLYTGDLAMYDEDGFFYIVGRKKEMIINGGFNIYPQEVENILYEHPDVKECAVIGIPDLEKGEVVKAFIVPKEGAVLDVEEVKGFCYRNLTPYKVPKNYELIPALPRNTVGKILKRRLVDRGE
ncbi:long-chain-fatty-acid--CoA ligase [Virgibacillus salexigens]|uniref:long-chain-fatty-acid--CoA ligase n=1 Tax=Virgibacillus salexigens TaxID=61016 RepID=UPI0030819E04